MEKETNDPVHTDLPNQSSEPVKKEEADLQKEEEEAPQSDSNEQSHEIDTYKKEDDPATLLPFGGE